MSIFNVFIMFDAEPTSSKTITYFLNGCFYEICTTERTLFCILIGRLYLLSNLWLDTCHNTRILRHILVCTHIIAVWSECALLEYHAVQEISLFIMAEQLLRVRDDSIGIQRISAANKTIKCDVFRRYIYSALVLLAKPLHAMYLQWFIFGKWTAFIIYNFVQILWKVVERVNQVNVY